MGVRSKRSRFAIASIYAAFFAFYIFFGLQPVDAVHYEISGQLRIPDISLTTDVTTLELKDHKLATPDRIVGAYSKTKSKTLLIGHSSTVFDNLDNVKIGEKIFYNDEKYIISDIKTVIKEDIDMSKLLAPAETKTIIIMTCAGEQISATDASHRLLVTAEIAKK